MTADDEFRKVAEDLRGLARSLRAEIRAAKWDAKAAARDARRQWRWDAWQGQWNAPPSPPPRWWEAHAGAGEPGAATTGPDAGQAGAAPSDAAGQVGDPGHASTTAYAGGPGPAAGASPGRAPAAGSGTAPPPPPMPAPWGWGPPWSGRPWPWGPYHHHYPTGRTGVAAPPAPAPAPKPAPPPPPPVRHRRDGSTLISLLLVLVGLAWLGSASGVISLSLETVLAAVLVVLGAAMVVTARTDWSLSRRHWPVWLGIVVLVLVMASAGSGGGLSRLHFGPTEASPSSTELGSSISNFAGPVRVVLPSNAPASDTTLHVHDVFGPISVVVPRTLGYRVHVDARTRFGPVDVPGERNGGGMFSHRTADFGTSGPMVNIDVGGVFGPVQVLQAE